MIIRPQELGPLSFNLKHIGYAHLLAIEDIVGSILPWSNVQAAL